MNALAGSSPRQVTARKDSLALSRTRQRTAALMQRYGRTDPATVDNCLRRLSPALIEKDWTLSRIIDLSHPVLSGQTTYPGLPAVSLTDYLSHESSRGKYADGVTFQISAVHMVANTGTAVDTPYHRYPNKADVATFPLSRLCDLPAIVIRIDTEQKRAIDAADLSPLLNDAARKAVLIDTGWSTRWNRSSYFEDHPHLTGKAAELLLSQGVVLVGIDSLNIDDTRDPARPVHTLLLEAEVAIVENLSGLASLPQSGVRFSAAPLRFIGMGACPVRAWAAVEDSAGSAGDGSVL